MFDEINLSLNILRDCPFAEMFTFQIIINTTVSWLAAPLTFSSLKTQWSLKTPPSHQRHHWVNFSRFWRLCFLENINQIKSKQGWTILPRTSGKSINNGAYLKIFLLRRVIDTAALTSNWANSKSHAKTLYGVKKAGDNSEEIWTLSLVSIFCKCHWCLVRNGPGVGELSGPWAALLWHRYICVKRVCVPSQTWPRLTVITPRGLAVELQQLWRKCVLCCFYSFGACCCRVWHSTFNTI